jgi:lipoate-protein ligase A
MIQSEPIRNGAAPRQSTCGRLLLSGPGEAAANMAIDAAILDRASVERGPTLRIYSWATATLSLGYFQSILQRRDHAESLSIPVVRRASGGGALIHDRELTYSLVMPTGEVGAGGASHELYRDVHFTLLACLADFGVKAYRFGDSGSAKPNAEGGEPFLCFQRRTDDDLIVDGYKVLGSAQRRGRGGLLQHGSLLLESSPAAPQLPGVRELTGRRLTFDEFSGRFAKRLGSVFDVTWKPGNLFEDELSSIESQLKGKFASESWTNRK